MSEKSHDKIEFDGLQKFLASIGFEKSVKVNNTLAYQHAESGTIVTLAIPEDGRAVRPADLLSILVRLETPRISRRISVKAISSWEATAGIIG